MVDTGCVLVRTLPLTVLYLSLKPRSFPPDFPLTLSACPVPGTYGYQSWLKLRAEVSNQWQGLMKKVTSWVNHRHCVVLPGQKGPGEGEQLASTGPWRPVLQHFLPGWIVERGVLLIEPYFIAHDFNGKLSGSDS